MRWREQQADDFVKEHLANTVGFGNSLKKIVKDDDDHGIYTPVKPALLLRLLSTHPWIYDRIQRFS